MFRRIRPPHVLLALGLLLAVLVSGPAAASIGVAGTGEPRFTNSDTNTVWFSWTKPADNPSAPYWADLAYKTGATGVVGSTGATGATGPFGPGNSGDYGVRVAPEPLIDGHSYGVCALGKSLVTPPDFTYESAGSCDDAVVSGKRTFSIIDHTRPSIQVTVNGGAALTRASVIPVRIDYTDNLAAPWPANFVCLRGGIDPATAKTQCDAAGAPQYAYDAKCSAPTVPSSDPAAFVNAFVCNIAAGTATPDGPVTFCASAADSALPDNPASSNQGVGADNLPITADRANLSYSQCGSTILDRTPPGVVVVAPAGGRIGETLAMSSLTQDATSGVTGPVAWTFGDGTPAASGPAVSHVFTKAGTYVVTAAMADVAGNIGRGTTSVVVTTGPASAKQVSGGVLIGKQLSAVALIKLAGAGGHVKRLSAGDLQCLVPGAVRRRTGRTVIPISFAAGRQGTITLRYSIKGRRIAAAGLKLTRAGTGTFKLVLPRKSPTGSGQLVLRWAPVGGKRITTIVDVKLVAAHKPSRKKHAKARKATAPRTRVVPRVSGAPAVTPGAF